MLKEAFLYKRLDKKKVQCLACKHRCIIPEGKTGLCATRGNENGRLYLYTYAYPAAINLDPIEKKPLFHFYPGTWVYSLGTFGCNFRCSFCQNWELSQFPKKESKFYSLKAKQLIQSNSTFLPPQKAVENALYYRADGIAYTYNEPAIWAEYAHDIAEIAKKHGLFNVFVSSGYETDEALDYLDVIDAYNVDLKAFSNEFYLKYCGTKLDNVLETIKSIYRRKKWIEITTLVIPGENDSEEQLKGIAEFIKNELSRDVPWHITRFHPDYKMLDKEVTPLQTLEKAFNIGKEAGLNYIYIGNVLGTDKETTYCPRCGKPLIERYGFRILSYHIKNGRCEYCGAKIAGKFR